MITYLQKNEILFTTVLFCLFIQFLKPLVFNITVPIYNIIINTLLFFVWYCSTILLSNPTSLYNES